MLKSLKFLTNYEHKAQLKGNLILLLLFFHKKKIFRPSSRFSAMVEVLFADHYNIRVLKLVHSHGV